MVSISGSTPAYQYPQRPDPSTLVDKFFAKVDTKKQGYIDKTELQAAVEKTSSGDTANTTATVDHIFKVFDTNGDNQLTRQEMTDRLKQLSEDAAAGQAAGGLVQGQQPPPPPPPGGAGGPGGVSATKAVQNYDPADTNKDGTVTLDERMTYDVAQAAASLTSSTSSNTVDSSTSSTTNKNEQDRLSIVKRIAQIAKAYGAFDPSAIANTFSIAA